MGCCYLIAGSVDWPTDLCKRLGRYHRRLMGRRSDAAIHRSSIGILVLELAIAIDTVEQSGELRSHD